MSELVARSFIHSFIHSFKATLLTYCTHNVHAHIRTSKIDFACGMPTAVFTIFTVALCPFEVNEYIVM